MNELFRYDGRRVVVTGVASGMGQETARQLGELGAEVIGLDLKEPTVAVKEFHSLNLGDPASIEAVGAAIGGPINALFNVAGISSGAADPVKVVEVNFLGTRLLTETLLPRLQPGSAIASVSSLAAAGYMGNIPKVKEFLANATYADGKAWAEANPDELVGGGYGLAKQAIILWTMMQGVELGPKGIRVNCIGPTVTATPFLDDTIKTYGQEFIDKFPKPLGRVCRPEEQASVLCFLNSDAASYVTGQLLWTDGGYMGGVLTGLIPT